MPIISNFPTGSGSGGGLALAAVSNIDTLVSSGKVYVKWTDPENMEVSGSVLAEWAGTLLVRKAGSVPTNRRDGVIVLDSKTRNAYQNTYFCDSGLTDGVKYFYKFFSYTTQNVYTDLEDNLVEITPVAVAPANVSDMSVAAAGNGKVALKWTDPAATVVQDGVTLATWASTKVVYKTDSYPTSPEDGTLVLNSTTRNAYSSSPLTITGLTNGTTYYIALFPISTDGAINTNTANRATGVPDRMVISTVPSQSGTLTYTGNAQSPSWSNYDSSKMTLGGATSGTNAGSYNATFTPTSEYKWNDSTTTAKTVAWSIAKAAGSLSISPTTMSLTTANPSAPITVTRAGDGVISAVSSDTNVATVSVSDTTVTVQSVGNGSATITVSVAAGTNHNAPENKTCSVSVSLVSTTLNDNTWAAIRSVSAAGTGANYWSIGDRKSVLINGSIGVGLTLNNTYWTFIIGFNHNSAKEDNGIHFQGFKTAQTAGIDICLCDSYYGDNKYKGKCFSMNHNPLENNTGGWKACDLRYDILGSVNAKDQQNAATTTPTSPVANTLMAALPADLRAVMQPMTKYTDNTGGGSNTASYVTSTIDYLPILAEFEIFGTRAGANSAEQNYQQQYAYYSAGNPEVKYKHNATSTAAIWWERSPDSSSSSNFCYVYSNGSALYDYSRFAYGLAPAFKI